PNDNQRERDQPKAVDVRGRVSGRWNQCQQRPRQPEQRECRAEEDEQRITALTPEAEEKEAARIGAHAAEALQEDDGIVAHARVSQTRPYTMMNMAAAPAMLRYNDRSTPVN